MLMPIVTAPHCQTRVITGLMHYVRPLPALYWQRGFCSASYKASRTTTHCAPATRVAISRFTYPQ
ncbi:hypothetical protein [Runella aurantiaca]|uniref:Uncharacterized protein n=1 Tax=Runella aurantiaca TaxID=2282308 RepID=A0A369HZW2_9BACT|nr:hypothetical protein [Runella aurantiaca]RDB02302.1 hypothetical protein DVG78_29555 [Runella aurantiaca]